MNVDKIITSNILGEINLNKDFYALVGASLIQFGIVYFSLISFMEKHDPTVNPEELLGQTAGSIIDKVRKTYKGNELKFTGDWYQGLVNARNKIIHGFVLRNNGKSYYCYKLNNGESGKLSKKFFFDFIRDCNMFLGAIGLQDPEMKNKYKLFKEKNI